MPSFQTPVVNDQKISSSALISWQPFRVSPKNQPINMKNVTTSPTQGGPLPVISGLITPVTHLFSAIYRGPMSVYL